MNFNQQDIEQLVGTKIKNLSFYQRAFTHKSALKEYEQFNESFETLEFMGDSVLGFIITKFLFDRYEERQEGFLTKARTKLVRSETLADIALKMGLNNMVLMDEKGMRNGWNNNPKILEDVFEALVGAIYLDLGLLHAKEFVLRIYNNPNFIDLNKIMIDDNFKDHLMKYCQIMNVALPEYRVVGHHEGVFYIDAYINGQFGGRGKPRVKSKPNNWLPEHSLNSLKITNNNTLTCIPMSKP
ncbi:RNAse III [Ostreococcus lucimarinus virus OlV5]|uniref:RNAse III n=1 Tax=Ostreococcus lucimarinus virus OlV5 TaxID=754064 RepID=UPI0002C064A5|nr:RNAse III [Ostreococcus lucimarinus virus OlV5]AGH31200.1 RNAse III [Ostreococcus lucimarinus virus OlV5]